MIQLNLLPPERKQYLASRRRNRKVAFGGSLLVGLLGVAALLLAGLNLLTGTEVAANKRNIEQTKESLKRFEKTEKLVFVIRERVSSLSAQEKSRLPWSKIAEDLAAATPIGIQLSQASLTSATIPHLQVAGTAQTKEKVADLRERLEQSERFEAVNIRQVGQSSDLSDRLLITFSLEANLAGISPPKPTPKPEQEIER